MKIQHFPSLTEQVTDWSEEAGNVTEWGKSMVDNKDLMMNGYEQAAAEGKTDGRHLAKCIKRLKEWGAPLSGWECKDILDVRGDEPDASYEICDLCDHDRIRFVHVMEHPDYYEKVNVGCICAGIMEGDILAAKERERLMRNRAKRRRNIVNRKWEKNWQGDYVKMYKGRELRIREKDGRFTAYCGYNFTCRYKGKVIVDRFSAMYAAFDLADPVSEVVQE